MTNENMIDLKPLFNIRILRFVITLISNKTINVGEIGSDYRGQLGFSLKQMTCQYDQFQNIHCSDCSIPDNCYYTSLFSPTSSIQMSKEDTIKVMPSPVRPFVFSFMTDEMNGMIHNKKSFQLVFSIFGPAIQNCAIFSAAAIQASERLGFTVINFESLYPDNQPMEKEWVLEDWINTFSINHHTIGIRCHTPLSMKKDNHVITTQFSFMDFIKAIIRRLRDLKRYYGNDDNMGHFTNEFYSIAKTIHCSTKTVTYQKKNRYSYSQHKRLPLSGFMGELTFTGNLQWFMPLLKAGELIHIGRGTSSGNGCVAFNKEDECI